MVTMLTAPKSWLTPRSMSLTGQQSLRVTQWPMSLTGQKSCDVLKPSMLLFFVCDFMMSVSDRSAVFVCGLCVCVVNVG